MNMKKFAWVLTCFAVVSCLGAGAAASAAGTLPAGPSSFEVVRGERSVKAWTFQEENLSADAPILFVMHGVGRNGEEYRDQWIPQARRFHVRLVAPEFSKEQFPTENTYNLGHVLEADGSPRPREAWSFSFLETVFDHARSLFGSTASRYFLFGHSAGAQFVHRFLYFVPEARIARVVFANAGWYTLPSMDVDFPYGLEGAPVPPGAVRAALAKDAVVLLGTADNDPNHASLRRTPEALAQGAHRLARGRFFFESARRSAEALGAPFAWRLAYAPGIAHSNEGIAPFAAEWLFARHEHAPSPPPPGQIPTS